MRAYFAFFSLLLAPCFANAQDPATQAAQQAAQISQQASMQAMQDAAEANRQAAQAAQQAIQDSQSSAAQPCCISWTAAPKFSIKPGKYSGPTTVRITDASRGAVIYYSTDGWSPTVNSLRYRGPILIDSTTTLQAIAIAPYSMRSVVSSAQYTISAAPAVSSPSAGAALSPTGPLSQGAVNTPSNLVPVPLVFDAEVSSKTASVGDKIPMTLSQDLRIGDFVVRKGTPATVTITQVDRSGIGGAPGTLSFEADDLHPESGPIPLQGGATRDGQAKPPNAAILIPMVGPLTALRHGTDAIITNGTVFTAYIDLGAASASVQ
ncbi:MAG: chitobiase/beta-hexosaminidase C-terminal domain-containing protein [Candidatus Acidiferrum sp.]